MTEFSAAADLDVRVTDESMRSARRRIEAGLGDVSVDVTGSMAPSGRQPRDPRTGQFMSPRGAEQRLVEGMQLDEERNELLQEILDEVEGGVAGGDGGIGRLRRPSGGGGAGGLGGGGIGGVIGVGLLAALLTGAGGARPNVPSQPPQGIPGVDPFGPIDVPMSPTGNPRQPFPFMSPVGNELGGGTGIDVPPTGGGTGGGFRFPNVSPEDVGQGIVAGTGAAAAARIISQFTGGATAFGGPPLTRGMFNDEFVDQLTGRGDPGADPPVFNITNNAEFSIDLGELDRAFERWKRDVLEEIRRDMSSAGGRFSPIDRTAGRSP